MINEEIIQSKEGVSNVYAANYDDFEKDIDWLMRQDENGKPVVETLHDVAISSAVKSSPRVDEKTTKQQLQQIQVSENLTMLYS